MTAPTSLRQAHRYYQAVPAGSDDAHNVPVHVDKAVAGASYSPQ